MFARIPQREAHRGTAARQAAARLRRLAAALAAVTCTLPASAAVMPAAWAVNEIPPGGPAPAPAAVVTAGGMPGWQITSSPSAPPWSLPPQPSCWTGRGPPAG
jgi:hypothetical protein